MKYAAPKSHNQGGQKLEEIIEDHEIEDIIRSLKKTNNCAMTARALGVPQNRVYRIQEILRQMERRKSNG